MATRKPQSDGGSSSKRIEEWNARRAEHTFPDRPPLLPLSLAKGKRLLGLSGTAIPAKEIEAMLKHKRKHDAELARLATVEEEWNVQPAGDEPRALDRLLYTTIAGADGHPLQDEARTVLNAVRDCVLSRDAKALADLVRPARAILKSRPERLARLVGVASKQAGRQDFLSRVGADGEPRCHPLPKGLKRSDVAEILARDTEQLLARGLKIASVLAHMRSRAGTALPGLKRWCGPAEDEEDEMFAKRASALDRKPDGEVLVREALRRCGMAEDELRAVFNFRNQRTKRESPQR